MSKLLLVSLKLEILTDPVKDGEHAGAASIVSKTLICSPEFTCTMSKNKSVAGVKKSVCDLNMEIYIDKHLMYYQSLMSSTNIQYNAKVTSIDTNTIRNISGIEYI